MRVILSLVLALSAVSWAVNGDMGNGDGSEGNPYLIEDLADFDAFADPNYAATYWAPSVHTKLMTNIDLSGRTYTTAVIAPTNRQFRGHFDGNSYLIANLRIEKTESYNGLFGHLLGSNKDDILIQNLTLTDPNIIINRGGFTGVLAGSMQTCKVVNCHVIKGAIKSANDIESTTIGGLVGYCIDATLCNSTSSAEVIGGWKGIGGLVGRAESGTLIDCSAYGDLRGADFDIGGLIGVNSADVTGCYAVGNVTGKNYVGGLVGSNYGTISNCYNVSDVSGNVGVGGSVGYNDAFINMTYSISSVIGISAVGGLVGIMGGNNYLSTIHHCYSGSSVDGTGINVGGLIGDLYLGVIDESFWNMETSETEDGVGNRVPDPSEVSGKTDYEMQMQSTFTGWDFSDEDGDAADWVMRRPGEDYPRLVWQETFMGDIAGLYGVDMADVSYLARYWGLDCGVDDCGRADIDGSGDVGIGDLSRIAEEWLCR